MSKQVWGTFSVKDHCEPNAFVAEVMLYDRLVIPVPPDDKERARWRESGWQPERLDKLLEILGDRAYVVNWDDERQKRWKARYDAGADIAQAVPDWAFAATRTELTQGLPRHVTGIQVITNYTAMAELERDLRLRPTAEGEIPLYGGRKRASFWRWEREFLDDTGITDQSAIRDAFEEMQDLLEEEKALVRKKWTRTGTQFAFLVGSVALGLLGGPLTAVAVGGAFVSVGQFAADRLLAGPNNPTDKPVSLLRDIRKHFGWN